MHVLYTVGPDDGYQAETGCPVIQHFLFTHSHHLVVLASCQPLCLVLTHMHAIFLTVAECPAEICH